MLLPTRIAKFYFLKSASSGGKIQHGIAIFRETAEEPSFSPVELVAEMTAVPKEEYSHKDMILFQYMLRTRRSAKRD